MGFLATSRHRVLLLVPYGQWHRREAVEYPDRNRHHALFYKIT